MTWFVIGIIVAAFIGGVIIGAFGHKYIALAIREEVQEVDMGQDHMVDKEVDSPPQHIIAELEGNNADDNQHKLAATHAD